MNDVPGAPRQSKRLLLGLGVLALVLAAYFVGRSTSSDPSPRVPQSGANQTPDPGPTSELNGVPVGYARSEAGAIAAATEFARVMAGGSADESAFITAMETLSAPGWRERAQELARNSAQFVRDQYGESASISFYPLRFKLADFSATAATVHLWGVAVAYPGDGSRAEESWLIGEVRLSLVDDDWRVSGQRSSAGPTPRLLQDEEGSAFDRLRGFREYEGVSES